MHRIHPFPATLEQGQIGWPEGTIEGKGYWAIRVRLQIQRRTRDLALLDLAIDGKLRACDLVQLRVGDVCHGDRVAARAIVMQQKRSARQPPDSLKRPVGLQSCSRRW